MGITAINPIAGTTSFVTSAAGSYLEDARNMGMTEEQSLMYGTIMGAVEGGTEAVISGNMLEHGAKLLGVNSIKREALHKVVSSFGFDIAENFAQEALTEPLNEGVKYIVSGNEYADFSNMGARMLKSGIDGAVSAIILAGNSVGINSAIKLSERIKSGKSVSQEQIKKVVEDCKNAGMPVDDILIESVKENTNALSQAINENNTTQIQELQEEISKKQQEWKQSTDTREKQIIQETIDNLNNELQNITTATTQNSISQTQSKENSTYLESARRYNIDTNNQTVKAIEQVTSQREIQARFDGDVFANNSVNALWRTITNSNGKTVREVVLNPNADTNKTLQNVIVHELTHDIEGSKEYSELKNLITNYDKNNIDYESARKSLEEIYSKVYDKNSSEFKTLVENEAVADILGSKLGDQEFITNLTTKKPSIAKRIYNWVVDKLNKINKLTGYKNEKLFWNDVKNKFENTYRQDYQGINTNAKYHVSENFSNEIDKVLNNELPSNTQVKARDYTPNILVNNGVKNLPMLITQKHIKSIVYNSQEALKLGLPTKNINYHGLGKKLLIKSIDNLDSPKAIYKTNDNDYLVITEFKDSNGREIVVPVQINGKGRYNDIFIDENQIKSVYGRNNLLNYLKNNNFEKIYEKNRESDFNEGIQYSNVADSSINNSISSSNKDVNTSEYSMQESKNNTLYSIAGKKGMTNLVKNNPRKNISIEILYDKAQQLQKIGIDNETIRQQTNWFQDRNGDWKFEFSDKDMAIKDNLNLQSGKSYKLGDVLKHNTLFTAYPELAEYNLNIINDNSIKGSFSNKKRAINISDTIVKSREKLEGTLIHEIQHAIQHIEGFEHGRSSKISKLAYYNSLGEIEASNTKERFLQDKYNNKDISNTPPESSKKNPQHKGLNRYIKERNILEKMKDSVYNYFNKKSGGNNDEINQEVNLEDPKQDNTLVDGRKIRRYVNEQEKWQSYLDKNYKNTGTGETIQDVKLENNSNIEYNSLESESDINGRQQKNKEYDRRRIQGLLELYKAGEKNGTRNSEKLRGIKTTEKISKSRVEQEIINYARNYSKKQLSSQESRLKQIIKNLGGDVIFYEYGNENYFQGISNTKEIYIDTLGESSAENVFYHELTHFLRQNNNNIYKSEIQPIVNEIASDFEYQEVIFNYANSSSKIFDINDLNGTKQNALAKEVVADYISCMYGSLPVEYGLPKKMVNSLKKSMDKILNINQNSNESSFILPVNNQNNNINLPTNNSQNNKLSDAVKEFSSPTIDYIKEKRSKNRASLEEIKDTLAQKFVNKGHYIDKLAKQTGNKNLTYLYDRTMNTFNEAQISIGEKQINSKGDVVGKSIIDLFEPAEKANLSKEFQDYLLNKHNISRYAHEKGIYGKEISAIDSSKTVAEYEKLHPEFKKWAEDVSKYNDNNLKDLVDNGLIAQSTYKQLKELYPDYVPTYRDIVDNISQYEDDRVGSNTLKRATQNNREILSVSESMAEQTLAIKKAIRMNNLGIELYKTLGKNSEIFDGIQYDTYAIETLGGDVIEKDGNGDNIFTIFVNGNMTQFRISDELYSAFAKDTLQNRINNSKVTKTLLTPVEKLTKAQRELLTTYNIGFAFSNPIKDFNDALVNTKYSQARFMKNYVKALYNLGTKGSYYESYKNNGGMANTYFDYDNGILPTSSRNPLKKFTDKIKNVNEILEQAPRIAEYISTIEKGGSIDEALYNAADITTNFKRGGDIAKVFNKYGANFLNASIQGLDKVYRNISGQNGARGYFNLLVKATLASVTPAILNHLLLGDDDDYENLQDYVKDNYYIFKTGDGTFFRIPKGRISSVLGGLARRVMETGEGDEVDWASLVETVSNSFAPNNPLDDNLFAPLKQASENKTWYGTDLVPSRLQDLPPAEQYDETTDKFSIWLGEKLNISPYKINYVLDQYSGGIGDTFLPMMTQQAEGKSDSMGAKLLAPLADKFTTDSVMKNKNVSKFYSLAEEINVSSNGSKATDEQILQNKYLNTIKTKMSDLYKEKREIQASDLPDSEKYEQAREIQQQINDLAESGLANYENINITGDYAEVNGTKYQKKDGNWKKIDDDKSEKLDQMNMTTKENNEYLQFESSLDEISSKYKEQYDALNENSSTYDEDKTRISSQKKTEIINTIINSGLSDEKKLNLFEDYYSSNTVEIAYKAGIDIDSCLSYELQTFTADKDANGKTISGSKKNKVINYVDSLNLSIPQKAIIIKTNNSFKFNDYNNEIVDYINNLNLTYYEKKELLEELDMKVLDDGTIIWE